MALSVPERVQWAVELLDVQPSDHILEIGCGPGQAVALVCARLTTGTITAIDRSATAVARARARNAGCIAAGSARIEQQTLTRAEVGRRFAKVFAINVNAFWTDAGPSLAALSGLVQPRGTAYLVYEPPSLARVRQIQRVLTTDLDENGFDVVDVHLTRLRASHGLCIVARAGRS